MKKTILFVIITIFSFTLFSNNINDTIYQAIQKGIKIPLAKNKKYFIKLGVHGQIWARAMQLNPNVNDFNDKTINYDADVLLKRGCFSYFVSLDKFTFFSMVAITAQTHTTSINRSAPSHPQFYFYDAWGSYNIANNKLIVGAGLNMYNGISRYSSASSMQTLGAEVPLIAAPNLTTTEQAARQLSLFATGNINSFSYRIAIAKPFISNTIPDSVVMNTAYHIENHSLSYKGYFEYQFFDKESSRIPFKTATYIGSKKVLNIGVGFDYHPNATISYETIDKYMNHDKLHLAADVFIDYPFSNSSAITFYAAQFWFDYGPNFIQNFGINDIYRNGISEYQYGTGKSTFLQMAYLLPSENLTNRIQPFYEFTLRDFNAVSQSLYHHNIGINYFVIGHKLKFTLQYENRPYINEGTVERKSLVIGKMQFSI